jgi:cytochrome c oxidase subunit I
MPLPVQNYAVVEQEELPSYLKEHTLRSWLLTTDHKRIGLLYLFTIIVFFVIAAIAAAVMRLNLLTPRGDLVQAET